VKPGQNVTIDADGTLNVSGVGTGTVTQVQTGPGITGGPITTTGTIGLASATSNQIGGVKPGAGLGVTGDGALFVEPATNSSIGGVIVGQGLNVNGQGVLAADPVPPGFLPAGTVQWFAGVTSPAGWVFCNGQTLNVATYPDLYAAIGRVFTASGVAATQFQVPDLRGQFIRGWDNRASGGVDNARAFGSFQNDSFKSHTHTLKVNTGDYVANFRNVRAHVALPTFQQQTGDRYGAGDINLEDPAAQGSPAIQNTGEAETRPKNVSLLPIIKL
jgi:microcystin-dependent protein